MSETMLREPNRSSARTHRSLQNGSMAYFRVAYSRSPAGPNGIATKQLRGVVATPGGTCPLEIIDGPISQIAPVKHIGGKQQDECTRSDVREPKAKSSRLL